MNIYQNQMLVQADAPAGPGNDSESASVSESADSDSPAAAFRPEGAAQMMAFGSDKDSHFLVRELNHYHIKCNC